MSGASLFELRARTPLDREGPEGGELSLAIRCSDTGQPSLTSIASLRVNHVLYCRVHNGYKLILCTVRLFVLFFKRNSRTDVLYS